jgi:uncharacterized protein (TIGR02246 family)
MSNIACERCADNDEANPATGCSPKTILNPGKETMKMRLVVAIVWLVIGLAVTTFAQQNNTVDPQTAQQIRALAMKYDEAFNRNDAAAVAALYTEDGVHAFKQISHGRPAIEKSYGIDFQAWHPSNRVITVDRLKVVGNEVRSIGRWTDTANPAGGAPSNHGGIFTWIIVREGNTWQIRRSTFSQSE